MLVFLGFVIVEQSVCVEVLPTYLPTLLYCQRHSDRLILHQHQRQRRCYVLRATRRKGSGW